MVQKSNCSGCKGIMSRVTIHTKEVYFILWCMQYMMIHFVRKSADSMKGRCQCAHAVHAEETFQTFEQSSRKTSLAQNLQFLSAYTCITNSSLKLLKYTAKPINKQLLNHQFIHSILLLLHPPPSCSSSCLFNFVKLRNKVLLWQHESVMWDAIFGQIVLLFTIKISEVAAMHKIRYLKRCDRLCRIMNCCWRTFSYIYQGRSMVANVRAWKWKTRDRGRKFLCIYLAQHSRTLIRQYVCDR